MMALFALSLSPQHRQQLQKPLSSPPCSRPGPNSIIFLKFNSHNSVRRRRREPRQRIFSNELDKDSNNTTLQDDQVKDAGIKAALSMLKFYKSGSGFDPPRWFDEASPPEQ